MSSVRAVASPIEPSRFRQARNAATKVFDCLSTCMHYLASCFSQIQISPTQQASVNAYCTRRLDDTFRAGLPRLANGRCQDQHSVSAALEAIRQEHPDDLQCDKTYLTGVDAGEETSTTRFIAIPVTLNQGIWGHIVMIVIDRENHTLEFYDPKGLSIRDLDGIPLRCSKREDIGALVKRLITRHRISRIVENTEKQQADNDSCGVYVSHFLAKRLEFPDKTTIFERPSISIYQMRLGLINAIFQRCALV